MARWSLMLLALLAGPGWAGDAWVAEYHVRDARGERDLTLVRDDTRVEYRVPGEPVRVWRRTGDGVELLELHAHDLRVVVYAPGDLRALGNEPDWSQLSSLVDPALRARLTMHGEGSAFAQPMTRHRGTDALGQLVRLEWLAEAGLPLRLRIEARGKDRPGQDDVLITLQRLTRAPAASAFTGVDGLLELDYADLGDMERDPFVRGLPRAVDAGHATH